MPRMLYTPSRLPPCCATAGLALVLGPLLLPCGCLLLLAWLCVIIASISSSLMRCPAGMARQLAHFLLPGACLLAAVMATCHHRQPLAPPCCAALQAWALELASFLLPVSCLPTCLLACCWPGHASPPPAAPP